ncbi:MAG: hypothetical protein ABH804_01300 [archaeon]
MEDSHIRRLPNEFWTGYLVRRLGYEGYKVKDFRCTNIDADNEEGKSWIFLENEIKTSKGEIKFNRMFNLDKNIFTANKKGLEDLSMKPACEYFLIHERDEGQEYAYRDFGFIIEDDVKATIQEHSSETRVPNFPGRNSWADLPLIEKYKGVEGVFYPKCLVDDVVRYVKIVGTPDKPVKIEKPKRDYSQGHNLGLRIAQIQVPEIPDKEED